MYDGHEILAELLLGASNLVILDHERRSVPVAYPLDEVECEAAHAVAVGDHNLLDMSLHDGVHHS